MVCCFYGDSPFIRIAAKDLNRANHALRPYLWQNTAKNTGWLEKLMHMMANDIKKLHDDANKLFLDWLGHPPVDRRHKQAFELLAEAVQLLHAAAINLGAVDAEDARNQPE